MANPRGGQAKRVTTKDMNFTSGVRADSLQNQIPVLDMQNIEMLPDGTGVYNRRGMETYLNYRPQTTPLGRKAILIESQPPNLTDGTFLALIVNTANGRNAIEKMSMIKPRTNLPGDTLESIVEFTEGTYYAALGATLVASVTRTGDISKTVTVDYASAYNAGSSGSDFTAVSGTLTFAPGIVTQTISVSSTLGDQTSNKSGTILLSNPVGSARIASPNPCNIIFTVTYAPVAYVRPDDLSTAVPVMMLLKGTL